MSDFSWDYVSLTASSAMVDLGKTLVATIAQAVEPGVYLIQPDVVYEVRGESSGAVVLRNGEPITGDEAITHDALLIQVAAELSGATQFIDIRPQPF